MTNMPDPERILKRLEDYSAVANQKYETLPTDPGVIAGDKEALLRELVITKILPEGVAVRLSGDPEYRKKLEDSYNDNSVKTLVYQPTSPRLKNDDADEVQYAIETYRKAQNQP